MLFSGKENVFRLFGCLGIRFTENQFRCLVRSNILRKMLSVLRKIKLCNQNRKNKRRENLINHSTASNGKVRVIQFNPIPHSHFPTNQTDPQKKQNPEKKNSSNLVKLREEGREKGDWVRSRGGGEGEIVRRRQDQAALESIFAWSARCCDQQDRCELRTPWCELGERERSVARTRRRNLVAASGVGLLLTLPTLSLLFCCVCESFFLSLFLPLHICEFLSLCI